MADIETSTVEVETEQETTETEQAQPSADAQLQQMRIEMAKLKKAQEKAASEAADYKKQLRAKMTEDEAAAQAKAEQDAAREARLNELEKENKSISFKNRYLKLGYPEELADKAATAKVENDDDSLFQYEQEFQSILLKNKEAEWLNNRPVPKTGTDLKDGISKAQFDRMGYKQRVEFQAKNPELYEKYTKK